jgi:transcriptional regulator with XRE-family HTH domain
MSSRVTVNEKAALVKRLLGQRGWTIADLAREIGLGYDAVRFILYRYQVSPRRAWKIERVLDSAIWTPPERFRKLISASKYLEADFVLMGFHVLRKRAAAIGVPATRRLTNKNDLLKAVLAHFDT